MSKKSLIVIEGPDGSGKSTLARRILESLPDLKLNGVIVHSGPYAVDDPTPVFNHIIQALKQFDDKRIDVVIMDRSPISELVYGPIMRGKVAGIPPEWDVWREIETNQFKSFETRLILLDAPDEVLRQRAYGARGEDFVPESSFMDVVNGYRNLHPVLQKRGWNLYRE